jgi:hypothetical protein
VDSSRYDRLARRGLLHLVAALPAAGAFGAPLGHDDAARKKRKKGLNQRPKFVWSCAGKTCVPTGCGGSCADCDDELALTVSTRDDDPLAGRDAFGSYHHAARVIWVRPGRDRADMAATLAHELAHAVTFEAAAAMPRGI